MEQIQTIKEHSNYSHKKFASQKRKRDDQVVPEATIVIDLESPVSKRRHTKGFFRPWLDTTEATSEGHTPSQKTNTLPAASTYHANMVRQKTRQRSPKEQQRRDRNTLACLLNRRARQAQDAHLAQQYEWYRAQQAAILEQQVRFSLYYRQMLQQAVFQQGGAPPAMQLPPQQQQFLQEMALSQQMMIFGSHQ